MACNAISEVHSEQRRVPSHYKVSELFPSRKVGIVRTEQLCVEQYWPCSALIKTQMITPVAYKGQVIVSVLGVEIQLLSWLWPRERSFVNFPFLDI